MDIHPTLLKKHNAHIFLWTAADFIELKGHVKNVLWRSEKKLSIKYALIRSHDPTENRDWRLLMGTNKLEKLLEKAQITYTAKHIVWITYTMLELLLGEDPDAWADGKPTEEIVGFLRDISKDISYI